MSTDWNELSKEVGGTFLNFKNSDTIEAIYDDYVGKVEGNFGVSHRFRFIDPVSGSEILFDCNSKRFLAAMIALKPNKELVRITRSGTGFNTIYKVERVSGKSSAEQAKEVFNEAPPAPVAEEQAPEAPF